MNALKKALRVIVGLIALAAAGEAVDLFYLSKVRATITTQTASVTIGGNGSTTSFNFSFVAAASSDIVVTYTDANGNATVLPASQYTLTINPPTTGQIWGIGGNVVYPTVASGNPPIASGATLTIQRSVPLLQTVSSNQGQAFPQAVEGAMDLLEMQIQQVNALFGRALLQPVSDTCTLANLPTQAQRANQVLGFDSTGCNPIAVSTLPSGTVSSAMQPVIASPTLAAARTAFGLGQLAVENFGPGLADNGSGEAQVIWANVAVSTNQTLTAANHLTRYACTGPVTFTLPRIDTVANGYGVWVTAISQGCTLTPNSNDTFLGQSSGASLYVPPGLSVFISSDGQTFGTWYPMWHSSGNATAPRVKLTASLTLNVSTSGSDSTGTGTATNPFATRSHAYAVLNAGYDLAGHAVTIQMANGTYTDGVTVAGPLVGQTSPSQLVFSGNCASGQTASVLIQPTTQINSYAFTNGAMATIECQKIDHNKILSTSGGADMISLGQGANVTLGNASLYNQYADLTYGCNVNPWNVITVAFRSYVTIVNDFNVDETSCLIATTGTVTSGSNVVTGVGTTTGAVLYMGVVGSNLPADAFVSAVTTNTLTFGCLYTSPCQATGTATEAINVAGGGQSFLDLGNGSQVYLNTNGDPSYSIIADFVTYNYFYTGFIFDNDLSGANFGGLTVVNAGFARGGCMTVEGLSVFTSYGEGTPYIPCYANNPKASTTSAATLSAGSLTISVSSATGFAVGDIISDVAFPNATFSAGNATISVSSATGILVGQYVFGTGVLSGALVGSIAGTNIGLVGCTSGPRCVSGRPNYLTETNVPLYFKNGCLASGTKIVGISGTTFTLSKPVGNTCTSATIWAQGLLNDNSVYQ